MPFEGEPDLLAFKIRELEDGGDRNNEKDEVGSIIIDQINRKIRGRQLVFQFSK